MHKNGQSNSTRVLSVLLLTLLLGFVFWPDLADVYRGFGFTSRIQHALDGDIRHVEVQLQQGGPRYHLADPERLLRLERWLLETSQVGIIRSAPPSPRFRMTFVFRDGHEEELGMSAINERGDVTIMFREYYRSGPNDAIAGILDPRFMLEVSSPPETK